MATVAGQIIYSGAMLGMAAAYDKAGGGRRGRAAAEQYMYDRFPQVLTTSANAVMRIFDQALGMRRNYAPAGPTYAPLVSQLPDARPLELAWGVPAPMSPADAIQRRLVFNMTIVEVVDRASGDVFWKVPATYVSQSPLQKQELASAIDPTTQRAIDRLQRSPTHGRDPSDFEVRVRYVGSYVGY